MARIYAGMLGPVALLTSLARGAVHAWPAEVTLLVAWTSLLAFAALGSVIGWTAERILEEEVRGVMAAGPAGAEQSKAEPPTAP